MREIPEWLAMFLKESLVLHWVTNTLRMERGKKTGLVRL
jgi:hypothetical protein